MIVGYILRTKDNKFVAEDINSGGYLYATEKISFSSGSKTVFSLTEAEIRVNRENHDPTSTFKKMIIYPLIVPLEKPI